MIKRINPDEIRIEKDVPVPEFSAAGRPSKYPWDKMEVAKMVDGKLIGDALFIPNVKITSVTGTISSRTKKHGGKYIARTVEGGVKIWRIE